MSNQSSILHKLFRRITGKHRYSYEYNSILFKFSDFQFYKDFYRKQENYIYVDKLLSIFNNVEFEMSAYELKKVLGKPVLSVDISSKPKLTVYLYKLIINQEKQKLFFHFYRNKLIIMSRVFPFATNQRVLEFQNNYLKQYSSPQLQEKKDKICFRDENDHYLYLLRNLEYTEHFIKINHDFSDFIIQKSE